MRRLACDRLHPIPIAPLTMISQLAFKLEAIHPDVMGSSMIAPSVPGEFDAWRNFAHARSIS